MKRLILLFTILSQLNAFAGAFEYKVWRSLQNDYGYEVKYPDCWEVRPDGTDIVPMLGKNYELSIGESEKCKTPNSGDTIPNGVGIYVGRKDITTAAVDKEIESETRASVFRIQRKYYFIFKRLKLKEGTEVLAHVENDSILHPYARWHYDVYCPNRKIQIVGPTIRNPSKELLEKFAKGDLAIPEPYKTIYESFKCTEPKIK